MTSKPALRFKSPDLRNFSTLTPSAAPLSPLMSLPCLDSPAFKLICNSGSAALSLPVCSVMYGTPVPPLTSTTV